MPDPIQEYSKNKIYNAVEGYTHVVILGQGIKNSWIDFEEWSKGPVEGVGTSVEAWDERIKPHVYTFTEHVAWGAGQHLMFELLEGKDVLEVHKVLPPGVDAEEEEDRDEESVTEAGERERKVARGGIKTGKSVVMRKAEIVARAIRVERDD